MCDSLNLEICRAIKTILIFIEFKERRDQMLFRECSGPSKRRLSLANVFLATQDKVREILNSIFTIVRPKCCQRFVVSNYATSRMLSLNVSFFCSHAESIMGSGRHNL